MPPCPASTRRLVFAAVLALFAFHAPEASAQSRRDRAAAESLVERMAAAEARYRGSLVKAANADPEAVAEADAALERLLARPGAGAAFGIAEFHAYRGDIDEAFDWLETSFDRSHSYETWANEARLTPFLRALHDDPRWEPLLAAQSR